MIEANSLMRGGGTLCNMYIENLTKKEKKILLFDFKDISPNVNDTVIYICRSSYYIRDLSGANDDCIAERADNSDEFIGSWNNKYGWLNKNGRVYNPYNIDYANYIAYQLEGSKQYLNLKPVRFDLRINIIIDALCDKLEHIVV